MHIYWVYSAQGTFTSTLKLQDREGRKDNKVEVNIRNFPDNENPETTPLECH